MTHQTNNTSALSTGSVASTPSSSDNMPSHGSASKDSASMNNSDRSNRSDKSTSDKATLNKGTLFIITAASGTGKTSLVKRLLEETDKLEVSISHTTRQPRTGEIEGQHYHFTTVEDFVNKIANNDFLEHAQVFDNYYGTSKQAVMNKLNSGLDVVLEIDWQGALQVKKIFNDAVLIFVLPPSKSALRDRLSARGQDSSAIIERRLAGAVDEMKQYVNFDYVVINDDFDTALTELKAIVISERLTCLRQTNCQKQLIERLLGAD